MQERFDSLFDVRISFDISSRYLQNICEAEK